MILVKLTKKNMNIIPCSMCSDIIKKYKIKKIIGISKIII